MIDAEGIRSIVQQYRRFGWELRRVLLTPEMEKHLGPAADELFGGIPVARSAINGAWFTRPSKHGRMAWEIRALEDLPYALIEVVDAGLTDAELENILSGTEEKLRVRHSFVDRGGDT